MTTDAGIDLYKAVHTVLAADSYIASQCSTRIYSSWGNQVVTAPFIRMWVGTAAVFEMDGAGEGSETDFSVYVFTKEVGDAQSRQIAQQIRTLLRDAALTLDGSDTVAFSFRDIIPNRDSDDPTLQMAVVRFTALTTTKS